MVVLMFDGKKMQSWIGDRNQIFQVVLMLLCRKVAFRKKINCKLKNATKNTNFRFLLICNEKKEHELAKKNYLRDFHPLSKN